MPDPLRFESDRTDLQALLATLFSTRPKRTIDKREQYTEPYIQALEEASKCYTQNPSKIHFSELKDAIEKALSQIQSPLVQQDEIKKCLARLSLHHGIVIEPIGQTPNTQSPPRLREWLEDNTLSPIAQARKLVTYHARFGFARAQGNELSDYMEDCPDYLGNLIRTSKSCFNIITKSEVCFFVSDLQMAEAIIAHAPTLSECQQDNHTKIRAYLDELTSGGRALRTLMNNSQAKALLDTSPVFQIAASEQYQTYIQELDTADRSEISVAAPNPTATYKERLNAERGVTPPLSSPSLK